MHQITQAKPPLEDDETWRNRQKKQSDEMTAVIERARQRRLEEEKIEEEQRLKRAQEKLRKLEEKMAKRDTSDVIPTSPGTGAPIPDGAVEGTSEEVPPQAQQVRPAELPGGGGGKRQRTESGSSDGSRQGRDRGKICHYYYLLFGHTLLYLVHRTVCSE